MKQKLSLLIRAHKYRRHNDPAEIDFAMRTIKPGDRVIDLGAHKGAYTYWLAKAAGKSGRVVSVEPQQYLAERLAGLMKGKPQVSVKWAAITTNTGTGTLSMHACGSSHSASIAGFPDGQVRETLNVPTITLADLMAEQKLDRVDFIKCDVEGHEGAVFDASRDVLAQYRPTILVEWEERHSQGEFGGVQGMKTIFDPLNYRIRFFQGGVLRPLSEFDASKHQVLGQGEYCNNFVLDDPSKK